MRDGLSDGYDREPSGESRQPPVVSGKLPNHRLPDLLRHLLDCVFRQLREAVADLLSDEGFESPVQAFEGVVVSLRRLRDDGIEILSQGLRHPSGKKSGPSRWRILNESS